MYVFNPAIGCHNPIKYVTLMSTLRAESRRRMFVGCTVTFKIASLMYQILHNRCPSYLVNLVIYNVTDPQRRQLRSSTTRAAVVRRTRTEFGKRAFSVCGPDAWNSLPVAVRNIDNHPAFRRALKSHLSNCVFPRNCVCSLYWLCNAQSQGRFQGGTRGPCPPSEISGPLWPPRKFKIRPPLGKSFYITY